MLTKDAEATAVATPPMQIRFLPKAAVAHKHDSRSHFRFTSTANSSTRPNAKVSVFDHGLLYGDGIFEGIRFYNGRVFRMEEHMERLWESARSICLDIPLSRAGNG